LVGRVTFHLAENKKNPQRPFAFLATYSHKLSDQAKVQHLQLAEALKAYAGSKDLAKLETLLAPVRRAADKSELIRNLLESRALFAPQSWTIRQAYEFLKSTPVMEGAGIVVRVPDWWSARRPARPAVQVRLGAEAASAVGFGQLLGFDVGLALEGDKLSSDEIKSMLESTAGLVLLRGKWVEVDQQKIQEALDHWRAIQEDHPDGIGFIEGMRMLAGADLDPKSDNHRETREWSEVVSGPWLRETLDRLRHPEAGGSFEPGRGLQATLRHYQVEGVRWLWLLTEMGLGACLADDMGLGKTIQVIDVLLQRKRAGKSKGANLLVVPASLLGNWRQELARFAPSLRILFAHRSECDADQLDRLAHNPAKELAGIDLVITTYPLIRRDEWFQNVHWSLIVLDEAQAIKNAGSSQTRSVKKLQAASRIVLTGTPVENHLGDLWSLFDFCCPGLLGSAAQFKQFVKRLRERQDAESFASLRRLVRPYILRRLKTDPGVAPDLPEKTEMRVECGLAKKQAVLYQKALIDFQERLEHVEGMERRGLVLSLLMQLKQLCNHPAQYLSGASFDPAESGKFKRLRELCEPIVSRQEKMLVFTQFQAMTEPLALFLADVFGRPGLVLHGGTPVRQRSDLVKQFQSDDGPPFFVISLKAGGSGLNLTAATHVIHFDRWWNPAVENQATDRAFRIGQKRNVLVHKFVCRGTIEERIDEMIRSKQSIADQILKQDADVPLSELSNEELLRLVALDLTRAVAED
jgi:non-specific serine/threonine protein kinase